MESSSLPLPRPLLLGPRVTDWLVARGEAQGTVDVPWLLRHDRARIEQIYALSLEGGCDVVCAATEATTPYALLASGHSFRAAALTALAVEVALESSARASYPVAVAGVVGAGEPPRDSVFAFEEHLAHAERLALAGVHILLAEANTLQGLFDVIRASLPSRLPVWARVPVDERGQAWGQDLSVVSHALEREGATMIYVVAPGVPAARIALRASAPLSRAVRLTGTDDFSADANELLALGLRGIGGPATLGAEALRGVCDGLRPHRPSEAPPSRAGHSLPPGLPSGFPPQTLVAAARFAGVLAVPARAW